jgi:hypothetical protein
MKFYPNILLISGSGRNTGKTTFACELIRYFSGKEKIAALKISPHFHYSEGGMSLINKKGYIIEKEVDPERDKDSSRMLRAGANDVFFIQAKDASLPEVFDYMINQLGPGVAIVCESGGAGRYIKPGVHIFMENEDEVKNRDMKEKADLILRLSGQIINFDMSSLQYTSNQWKKE